MRGVLVVLFVFIGCACAANVTIQVLSSASWNNLPRFSPGWATVNVGDTIIFQYGDPPAAQPIVETTTNNCNNPYTSAPCTSAANPRINFPVPKTPNTAYQLFVDPSLFRAGEVVSYKGNQNSCTGQGTWAFIAIQSAEAPTYPSCQTQTTRTDCMNIVKTTGATFGACIWCGASDSSGYCYQPLWSGSQNCPCTQSTPQCLPIGTTPAPITYWGCDASQTAAQCKSFCYSNITNPTQCNNFQPSWTSTCTPTGNNTNPSSAMRVAVAAVMVLFALVLAM